MAVSSSIQGRVDWPSNQFPPLTPSPHQTPPTSPHQTNQPNPTHNHQRQSSGPKFLAIKTRKRASKAEYSKRLEQYEMDFTAQIYKHADVDALLAAASPTDDA
jgi:hypothetical protein